MAESDPAERERDVARYRNNLQGEIDSAALYGAMAENETNPQLKEVYRRLAAVEEVHAEFWRNRLTRLGAANGAARAGLRTRILIWLARRFGPSILLPLINSFERSDSHVYDAQPEAISEGLPQAERSHARIIEAAAQPLRKGIAGGTLATLEGRHRTGGNALRAAVLGANDGLVSNLSLVMGVAGAAFSERTVLVTGLAGLLAGACSMAMGEWLSVTSARELYQRQIATEADELRESPLEEKEELILIYEAKGLPKAQATALAERIIADPSTALDTLAREELGIDPAEMGGNPWSAAGFSFCLFAVGAVFPVAPFFFVAGNAGVAWSLAISALALGAIGVATSLFSGRTPLYSAVRQVLIGAAAAAITYGTGALIGVSLT